MNKVIEINCDKILDWPSFHDVFADAFGFPGFYGRNGNAWIDCMTNLDDAFSDVSVPVGGSVTLQLKNASALKTNFPEALMDILEMSAFVNFRRIEIGAAPILFVSSNA